MDERKKFLLSELSSGDVEAMERAATLIAKSYDAESIKEVLKLLKNKNPRIRTNAVTLLAAIGSKNSFSKIKKLSKNDKSENVRIAAAVAIDYFGNINFQELKSKIKKAAIDKLYKREIELPEKERLKDSEHGLSKLARLKASKIQVFGICFLVLFLILVLFFHDELLIKYKPEPKSAPKVRKMNELIKERIMKIYNFKKDYLSHDGTHSEIPMTISLPTYSGDTYGDVANSVYSSPEFQKSGMNTLLAFWRKHNFDSYKVERNEDLLQLSTEEEKIIFPNLSAMRIKFNLNKGSAAYQAINKTDPDIEIDVVVNKVILK